MGTPVVSVSTGSIFGGTKIAVNIPFFPVSVIPSSGTVGFTFGGVAVDTSNVTVSSPPPDP